MKKMLTLLGVIFFGLILTGCTDTTETENEMSDLNAKIKLLEVQISELSGEVELNYYTISSLDEGITEEEVLALYSNDITQALSSKLSQIKDELLVIETNHLISISSFEGTRNMKSTVNSLMYDTLAYYNAGTYTYEIYQSLMSDLETEYDFWETQRSIHIYAIKDLETEYTTTFELGMMYIEFINAINNETIITNDYLPVIEEYFNT